MNLESLPDIGDTLNQKYPIYIREYQNRNEPFKLLNHRFSKHSLTSAAVHPYSITQPPVDQRSIENQTIEHYHPRSNTLSGVDIKPESISISTKIEKQSSHTSTKLEKQSSYTSTKLEKQSSYLSVTKLSKKVSFFQYKGLLAPVFTCFEPENNQLTTKSVDRYASWLKSQNVGGVFVNSVIGEGPLLSVAERKENAEAWLKASIKYSLIVLVQIGGAPMPDVTHLAKHADSIGAYGVVCLPDLFHKPQNIDQLISYCGMVARASNNRPFFYYHIPKYTGIDFDMAEFCSKAEQAIPSFMGLQFSCTNLEMGARCLRQGRVIILGPSTLLASSMILGFETMSVCITNIRPALIYTIYKAMQDNNLELAKRKQNELNELIMIETRNTSSLEGWVPAIKNWFNREMFDDVGIIAGPTRKYF